jgi:hypothetical protein
MVVGIGLLLVGLFASVAGIAIVLLAGPDGSVGLAPTRLLSDGHAVTLPQLDIPSLPAGQVVTLDVAVTPADQPTPIFLGIGPSAAIDAYLDSVRIDVIQQIDWPGAARTEVIEGSGDLAPPAGQPFWVTATSGAAPTLHWQGVPGDWTLVIMRVDGRAPIDVTATGSVTVRALGPLGIFVVLAAVGLLGVGTWITVRAAVAAPVRVSTPPTEARAS